SRPTSLHPALAVVAVAAGFVAMSKAGLVMAPFGLRLALVTAEVFLALPGVLLLAMASVPLASGLGLVRVPGPVAPLAALGGATLWAASLGLMNVQFVVWRPPEAFLDTFRALHEALKPRGLADGLLSVAAIGLMPAVCEETLFRGLALPSLGRMGPAAGLVG